MKPSIPKGTRDFLPAQVYKRNFIFDTIRSVFKKYGYQPIETPTMELLQTLTGKYGEEGDKLIFKVLNNGDFLSKADQKALSEKDSGAVLAQISKRGLRYDLTVPFARYVVMHQNEIDFPFKRYQIQPVWRADRPQKGRFREFFQCDADVVGSNSLLQEVEFVQLYDAVFSDLKLEGVIIKLNNRKILAGITEVIGAKDKLIDFTVALDKLDKIGEEGVKKEMLEKGISKISIEKAAPLFSLKGTNIAQLDSLEKLLSSSEDGSKGVDELRFIVETISDLGLQTAKLAIDVTLARGLNYYTGAIFEVAAPEKVQMGSIGGGGRYDDLTGIFGLKDVSGVGISFGLDRIYLVLEELELFPKAIDQSLEVLFMNYGEKEAFEALKLVTLFRKKGIKADLYPDSAKNQKHENKQFKFAKNKNVPFIVIIGEEELKDKTFTVKNIKEGTQESYSLSKPEEFIKTL